MRQFSEQEKQLIYSIYRSKDSNGYVLTNVFAKWLYGEEAVGYDVQDGCLVFDGEQRKDAEQMLAIQKEFIQTALLVKYLEDEGYIYLIEDSSTVGGPQHLGKEVDPSHMSIRFSLPKDIANIINRSLYRVYVSYALIQLVENGFKTYEELQLLASNEQLKASSKQLAVSEAQLKEARKQTKEAHRQTEESKKQTAETIKQTTEAHEQTTAAQTQTEEAIEQTSKAIWTMIFSIVACVISAAVPIGLNKCSHQEEKHVEIINSINGVNTTIQRGSEQINTYIDSINTNEMQQVKQNDSIIKALNKRENTQNRKK